MLNTTLDLCTVNMDGCSAAKAEDLMHSRGSRRVKIHAFTVGHGNLDELFLVQSRVQRWVSCVEWVVKPSDANL